MIAKVASSASRDAAFPTIPRSRQPIVGSLTTLQYWYSFLLRHYWHGPKRGLYGPPRHEQFLRRIEARIAARSAAKGSPPTHEIPSVDAEGISPAEFQARYLVPNSPVVLRGMAKDWPAVREWTPDFFRTHHGDEVIPTRLRGGGIANDDLRFVEMSVTDLVDDIERGGECFGGHVEDIWHRNPELIGAVDLDMLQRLMCQKRRFFDARLSRIASLQLFLSGAGTRSGFHCAGGPNLFVMVHGHKRWTFVDPKFSMWMHPVTRKDMFYAASPIDWLEADEAIAAAGFPLYRFAPKHVVDLHPGDVLFSPQWWWHAVETTCPSIGVASRTINKFFLGHRLFSTMWVFSPVFWRLLSKVLRTGWGSDDTSGARVAFAKR